MRWLDGITKAIFFLNSELKNSNLFLANTTCCLSHKLYLHLSIASFMCEIYKYSSVQFSHSVMSDSLWSHELQHTRPPCPSPTPRVHPNSYPSSWWCHPAISSSVTPFSSCLQSFPNESVLCIRWPKYWSFSFSISPSNEHPGLISFRMDWLDLLAVQGLWRVFSNTTVQNH